MELEGINTIANNPKKNYYMDIEIDKKIQGERKKITNLDFVRKGGEQVIEAETTFSSFLNATNVSYFNELFINNKNVCLEDGTNCQLTNFTEADPLFISENVTIWNRFNFLKIDLGNNYYNKTTTDLFISQIPKMNATNYYTKQNIDSLFNGFNFNTLKVNNKNVCLEDGTNCQDKDSLTTFSCVENEILKWTENSWVCSKDLNGTEERGDTKYPVMFMSTIRGSLTKYTRYLPLAIDVSADSSINRASFLIGKDLVITGLFWSTNSNTLVRDAKISLLKSSSGKDNFQNTNLDINLGGKETGKSEGYYISFSAGDSAVLEYAPYYSKETGGVDDLSITLIGYYK